MSELPGTEILAGLIARRRGQDERLAALELRRPRHPLKAFKQALEPAKPLLDELLEIGGGEGALRELVASGQASGAEAASQVLALLEDYTTYLEQIESEAFEPGELESFRKTAARLVQALSEVSFPPEVAVRYLRREIDRIAAACFASYASEASLGTYPTEHRSIVEALHEAAADAQSAESQAQVQQAVARLRSAYSDYLEARRDAVEAGLDRIQEELHRNVGNLGGLTLLLKAKADEYPPDRRGSARMLGELARGWDELTRALEEEITALDVDRLGGRSDQLLERVWDVIHGGGSHAETMATKLAEIEQAAVAAGLSAAAVGALQRFAEEWQEIKITDAPNPYFNRESAYNADEHHMSEQMQELYAPAHRYIHVDGDQYVNGAKTAAGKVARERLAEKLDLASFVTTAREAEEANPKLVLSVEASRKEEVRAELIQKHLIQWYATEGAASLRGQDDIAAAALDGAEGGAINAALLALSDRDRPLLDQLNARASAFMRSLEQQDPLPAPLSTAYAERMAELVEEAVIDEARSQRAKAIKEQTLQQPEYWSEAGRMVLSAGYGRCFSCAGAAIHKLVLDPSFDGLVIQSAGNKAYDHHFVLLSPSPATAGHAPPGNTLVVDVWQANQGSDSPVIRWEDFMYGQAQHLVIFATIDADVDGSRRALRERCASYGQ